MCKANANSIEGEINSNTITVGDFNTPFTAMDRSSRQKINKETQALKDTLDQRDLIDIYKTFHPKAVEYSFLSSAHGTSSRIDHILGHKNQTSVNLRKLESYQASFLTTML
uniref:Endonuclease/exonuclease/phosphatase domain-containing protein n=1 Tax=Sus scrofa TaxID=9823 RepID=A0A8D0SDL8_PIG